MLDGVHVGVGSDALLPTTPGLQQGSVQPRISHMHARLGQHGRVLGDARHLGARSQRHLHRAQLPVHILDDETRAQRSASPRQGVRHRPGREPVEPQPHCELRAGRNLLDQLGSVRLLEVLRVLGRRRDQEPHASVCRRLGWDPQLLLEGGDPDHSQSSVQAGTQTALSDRLLQEQSSCQSTC